MNLIEAIKLYCHVIQKTGYSYEARKAAHSALAENNIPEIVITFISDIVSNDGIIADKSGSRFALTEISSS